jgi:hypothetical protein
MFQAFFVKPTVQELARVVEGLSNGDDVIVKEPSSADLEKEAVLPADIVSLARGKVLNISFCA